MAEQEFKGITPEMYLEEAKRAGPNAVYGNRAKELQRWYDWIKECDLEPLGFAEAAKVYQQAEAQAWKEKEVDSPPAEVYKSLLQGSADTPEKQKARQEAGRVIHEYHEAVKQRTFKILERWDCFMWPYVWTAELDPETLKPIDMTHDPATHFFGPLEEWAICKVKEGALRPPPYLKTGEEAAAPIGGLAEAIEEGYIYSPSNPITILALQGIWGGGENWQKKNVWSSSRDNTASITHRPKRGGHVTLYVDPKVEAEAASWTLEQMMDNYLKRLSPLTGDVALAVLGMLSKSSSPMIEPVIIKSEDIRRLKGVALYGQQRKEFDEHIAAEMEWITRLRFDIYALQAADPEKGGRWNKQGISWKGDRLFDIVAIEDWQDHLFGGRGEVAVSWSVRAGQWAYYFLSERARRWVSGMAATLFTLSHRHDRRAEQVAKKVALPLFWCNCRAWAEHARAADRAISNYTCS